MYVIHLFRDTKHLWRQKLVQQQVQSQQLDWDLSVSTVTVDTLAGSSFHFYRLYSCPSPSFHNTHPLGWLHRVGFSSCSCDHTTVHCSNPIQTAAFLEVQGPKNSCSKGQYTSAIENQSLIKSRCFLLHLGQKSR